MYVCDADTIKAFENHEKVLEGLRAGRFMVLDSEGMKIYVFRGVERDYIVSPCSFCMCYDFLINVLSRRIKTACYHVVGFEIARLKGKLYVVHVRPDQLADIIIEIAVQGFSHTLRRIVSKH